MNWNSPKELLNCSLSWQEAELGISALDNAGTQIAFLSLTQVRELIQREYLKSNQTVSVRDPENGSVRGNTLREVVALLRQITPPTQAVEISPNNASSQTIESPACPKLNQELRRAFKHAREVARTAGVAENKLKIAFADLYAWEEEKVAKALAAKEERANRPKPKRKRKSSGPVIWSSAFDTNRRRH